MLLEVRDIRVHYGKAEILKGISLDVREGTIVTLIGANGAGKTTAMRSISGLKRLTSGSITFEGKRVDEMPIHEIVRLGIAHVPEGRKVFATMTVRENLLTGAYLSKSSKEISEDLERIYGHFPVLKDRRDQASGSLSGGEQQMLATTRALMSRPKLLLMDEPSMGLSPLLVGSVGKIIQAINKDGKSIVLVEQNAIMALNLAHYAYVLELGSIAVEGPGKDLKNNPEVQKAYLGA